jgi:hypothetical protein
LVYSCFNLAGKSFWVSCWLPKELIWESLGGLSVLLVARIALFWTHVMVFYISPFSWLRGLLSPTGQGAWCGPSSLEYLVLRASSLTPVIPQPMDMPPLRRPFRRLLFLSLLTLALFKFKFKFKFKYFFPSSAHIPDSYSNCMGAKLWYRSCRRAQYL